ncbi:hypothetical protein [Nostoc sp. LEGE 12447]|nr:hypothetical protein [Nostoc sp. LEGE 12447]
MKILIRGDSAYSREEIMAWCESQREIDYNTSRLSIFNSELGLG